MRSEDENVLKRDAEATRYFNDSDEENATKQSFEHEQDFERQGFEEEHFEEQLEEQQFEEQQSEEDENIGSQRMAGVDEEADESSDVDNVAHMSNEYDEEVEQKLMESSSGSWESGDEDGRFDDDRERSVTVARETPADIPVSRLNVVSNTDRRQKQQPTSTSLRGQ